MVNSISYGVKLFQEYQQKKAEKTQNEQLLNFSSSNAAISPVVENQQEKTNQINLDFAANNNVKTTFYAAAQDKTEQTLPAASASSGTRGASGGSEEAKSETIYKTTTLPDGSRLLQIITTTADGDTKITTTKLPPLAGKAEKENAQGAVPEDESEKAEGGVAGLTDVTDQVTGKDTAE